jgi:hypothetical protein
MKTDMAEPELTQNEKATVEKKFDEASALLSFYLSPPIRAATLIACEEALRPLYGPDLARKVLGWLAGEGGGWESGGLAKLFARFHFSVVRAALVAEEPEGLDFVAPDVVFEGQEKPPLFQAEFRKLSGEAFLVTARGDGVFRLLDRFLALLEKVASTDSGRRWLSQNREKLLELRTHIDDALMRVRDSTH